MTSNPFGSKEPGLFGSSIYILCVDSLSLDVITHANDGKLAFRQIKLHPNIMGVFSCIIADQLFLSCRQPFGADFCPSNWETVHQVLEKIATPCSRTILSTRNIDNIWTAAIGISP
jgi:hypothetical protein